MERVLENREISVFFRALSYPRVSETPETIGSDDPALVRKYWHFNRLPKIYGQSKPLKEGMRAGQKLRSDQKPGS
jgi:hypothetical protein